MKKNIRKLHESFQHAFRGLGLCIHGERNFRVHMTAAFYVTVFALMGRATAAEAAVLCLCFGLTMGAELMNTAIERLCDRQASGYDGFVRNAKDIAAAGVFVCAAACVAVGVCIFLFEGVLFSALSWLLAHLWAAAVLLVSIPAALWFIFKYGRIQ
ncbi:diacylglycerol kinase family protein [Agathobaculum sp.]|uniref:diacylglycerol kinase family protein n=1 Tax=Agathobaculum sp. TaxID=2048138 RepID=UPI001C39DA7C|nr:diacylglycerol kinase family protein [Agathobaculum sp.]MBS6641236.1 diacylglycerol kinase family protein [Clostridiaceae bacterium]HIX10527.1 diacylglycerol kinase family protein [Candidatus Agathobaculum pullistercoris]